MSCPAGSPDPKPFHILIIGGGPAGLFLAHLLSRFPSSTPVTFHLIEKQPSLAPPSGAGLGLWPQCARLLHQTSLHAAAAALAPPLHTSYHLGARGEELARLPLFAGIAQRHGYGFLLLERVALLRLLAERLPAREERVSVGVGVRGVEEAEEAGGRVRVLLEDGRVVFADMVVGADGVRSVVREEIGKMRKGVGGTQKSYKTRYRCLFGTSPLIAGARAGEMIELHDKNVSFQVLTQPDRIFWFVFEKISKKARSSGEIKPHYSDEDAHGLARKYYDHKVTQTLTLGELWDTKLRATLTNLEEGVMKHWFAGRMVCIGDAVHKMTPNLALGANAALESAACLANQLHHLLSEHPRPRTSQISSAFAAYKTERTTRAKASVDATGFYTRFAAWEMPGMRSLTKVMRHLGDGPVYAQISGLVKGGVVLDFVEGPDGEAEKSGSVPWERRWAVTAKKKGLEKNIGGK